jgi:hypothetical protein
MLVRSKGAMTWTASMTALLQLEKQVELGRVKAGLSEVQGMLRRGEGVLL